MIKMPFESTLIIVILPMLTSYSVVVQLKLAQVRYPKAKNRPNSSLRKPGAPCSPKQNKLFR